MWRSLCLLLCVVELVCVSSLDCESCVHLSTVSSQGQETNVIIHSDDSIEHSMLSVCSALMNDTDSCLEQITFKLSKDDWVTDYLMASENKDRATISRHIVFSVVHRLRRFSAPRHLRVYGANKADALIWNAVNSRVRDGIVCFVNDRDRFAHELPLADGNCPYTVVQSITGSSDAPYFGIDSFLPLADFPVEVVVIYPSQMCRYEDDVADLFSSKDELLTSKCLQFLGRRSMNGVCTRRNLCMQTYFSFAVETAPDDAYVFVVADKSDSSRPSSNDRGVNQLDFTLLEQKFLYKHVLSPHVDDLGRTVMFYTSQEPGELTLAGRRGSISSSAKSDHEAFMQCIDKIAQQSTRSVAASAIDAIGIPEAPHRPRQQQLSNNYKQQVLQELQARGGIVVGVLFCCRRRHMQVLLPYLIDNLRANGGIVDHYLVFHIGTEHGDEGYPLEVASRPGFEYDNCTSRIFGCAYSTIVARAQQSHPHYRRSIFVKVDDDILFIARNALSNLVWTRLHAGERTIVHGNGINHMHAPYFQSHLPLHSTLRRLLQQADDDSNLSRNPFISRAFSNAENTLSLLEQDRDQARSPEFLNSLRPALHVGFYDRKWERPQTALAHHQLFLAVMNGAFDDILKVSPNFEERVGALLYSTVNLTTCFCLRPQPGFGLCTASGHFRSTINVIAFELGDIVPVLDLLQVHDEMTLTALLAERHRGAQLIAGNALYSHAAFTPQRRGAVLQEHRLLQQYAQLGKAYLSEN